MITTISLGDALIVTLFSITMVFLVLIVLSVFISLLKNLDKKVEEPVKTKTVSKDKVDVMQAKQEVTEKTDDGELVAVISAAIAASLGAGLPDINIKSIRRVNDNSSLWSSVGRQEQIYNKI